MKEPAKIVALINQKGGVAKTTTTANIGACLAAQGYRTLLIDMDPQANLTLGLGITRKGPFGLHHVLQRHEGVTLGHVAVPVFDLPLRIAPATIELANAERLLTPMLGSVYRLKLALDDYLAHNPMDWVFIDCPPTLGRLTEMSVVASTHLIIPTEPKLYSFAGMDTLNRMFLELQHDLKVEVSLLGVLLTLYEKRTRLHQVIAAEIRERFGALVFDTTIRRSVRVSEPELEGKPASLFDPRSGGAQDYQALTAEVLRRVGLPCRPAHQVSSVGAATPASPVSEAPAPAETTAAAHLPAIPESLSVRGLPVAATVVSASDRPTMPEPETGSAPPAYRVLTPAAESSATKQSAVPMAVGEGAVVGTERPATAAELRVESDAPGETGGNADEEADRLKQQEMIRMHEELQALAIKRGYLLEHDGDGPSYGSAPSLARRIRSRLNELAKTLTTRK